MVTVTDIKLSTQIVYNAWCSLRHKELQQGYARNLLKPLPAIAVSFTTGQVPEGNIYKLKPLTLMLNTAERSLR